MPVRSDRRIIVDCSIIILTVQSSRRDIKNFYISIIFMNWYAFIQSRAAKSSNFYYVVKASNTLKSVTNFNSPILPSNVIQVWSDHFWLDSTSILSKCKLVLVIHFTWVWNCRLHFNVLILIYLYFI